MNELMLFKNEEFGEIRTLKINDEIYFVGKDITAALGYKNGNRDINRHVDKKTEGGTVLVPHHVEYRL